MIIIRNTNSFRILDLFCNPRIEYPKLLKYLIKNEPISVLDVACEVPINLFSIFHLGISYKILKGIDKCDEAECIHHFLKDKADIKADLNEIEYTFYNLYQRYFKASTQIVPKIQNRSIFEKTFISPFEFMSLEKYFQKESMKYNLIIVSNILHLYDKKTGEIYFEKITKLLEADGLLIIRIQNKNSQTVLNHDDFFVLFRNYYPDGEVFYFEKENIWDFSIFINKAGLIS